MRRSDVIAGIFLLLVGVLLLLRNAGVIEFSFSLWWPSFLIAIGIAKVISGKRLTLGATLLIGLGLLFQVLKLKGISLRAVLPYWPVLLVAAGLWLLLRGYISHRFSPVGEERELDVVSVFAAAEKKITSKSLKGGRIEAFMGSVIVDLSEAEMAGQEACIEVHLIMGTAELTVPSEWEVVLQTHLIFASAEDRTKPKMGILRKKLYIKGDLFMASLEIKN